VRLERVRRGSPRVSTADEVCSAASAAAGN
jgi:hypothetical protein